MRKICLPALSSAPSSVVIPFYAQHIDSITKGLEAPKTSLKPKPYTQRYELRSINFQLIETLYVNTATPVYVSASESAIVAAYFQHNQAQMPKDATASGKKLAVIINK
ncbi:hypothetical protein SARC_15839, partial [Sphaeroforma arctica JP610]